MFGRKPTICSITKTKSSNRSLIAHSSHMVEQNWVGRSFLPPFVICLSQFPFLMGRCTKSMVRVSEGWWLYMCLAMTVSFLCFMSLRCSPMRWRSSLVVLPIYLQTTRAYRSVNTPHWSTHYKMFRKITFELLRPMKYLSVCRYLQQTQPLQRKQPVIRFSDHEPFGGGVV